MAIQTVKTGAAVNDGTGDDARTAFTKINQNFTDNANAASRLVGKAAGNVMEVMAFGLGSNTSESITSANHFNNKAVTQKGSLQGYYDPQMVALPNVINTSLMLAYSGDWVTQVVFSPNATNSAPKYRNFISGTTWTGWANFWTTANTTKDPNGFIKGASPIVSVYADKIELNDEAAQQDITFEKIGVGDYLIKGSTGFAQEGWYIETPKDANGNVLVAAVYEQLENNDISVKTYDYMLNKKGRIVPDLETPLDIPATRWIDLRLQELPQANPQPFDTDETVVTNAE